MREAGCILAVLLASFRLGSLGAEDASVGPQPSGRVHIFYYPWYGNPEVDGGWRHWDHPVLLREGSARSHSPPEDIGAGFYPELGCYSSRSAAVLEEHIEQMRAAGAGVVVTSWWGRGRPEDAALPLILEAAAKRGLEVAIHLEPYPGRGARSTREDLAYLLGAHGASPALHRAATAGHPRPRPVVYVYDSYLTSAAEWATILASDAPETIRGTDLDAVMVGLYVKPADRMALVGGGFDGCYTYFASDGFTPGSTSSGWAELAEWARSAGLLFCPSVGPGYDDTRIRPWNARTTRGREGGAYYDRMFAAALRCLPDWISITSFNEWHEGTQIEPAAPKRTESYTYQDYEPLGSHHYLKRTRYWVDAFTEGFIETVEGPVPLGALGKVLPHEHILCDFRGARAQKGPRPEPGAVLSLMLPRVREAKARGFTTIFDCTPAWIGRDPALLARFAFDSGVRLVTNTGYYGAAGDKFLPEHAFVESAAALAERWTREWRMGIDDTGIRPGFLKIGIDAAPLSEVDAKLVRAAARAHLRTGLTVACHTSGAPSGEEALEAFVSEGAGPGAFIAVHADGYDEAALERLARRSAWVELDAVGGRPVEEHLRIVRTLVAAGLAGRILLSHDAGWYQVEAEDGGAAKVRPFTALADELIPGLEKVGVGEDVVERIVRSNPAEAFKVAIRRR